MFTGKLDRLITLESNSPSRGTYGEESDSWSTIANVWAEKMNPRVVEKYTAEQDAGFRFITWRIRWRNDVDNLDRVTDQDGNVYNIHGVIEIKRRRYHLLKTELVL